MTEPRLAGVTRRELAVIRELACDGASDAEIADRLYISINTVKAHMKRALAATGEPNRTSLAVAVLRRRVVLVPKGDVA